jgi:myo-inositol-1(or 4)-monophosphatase
MHYELIDTARAAAAAGAEVLRGRWGSRLRVEHKAAFDFVTDADRQAEAAVLGVIRERHPGHAILAEESEAGHWEELCRAEGCTWVVDPLDGTTNFIHGFPHVAVSVAAVSQGRSLAGVVVDVTRGEEFWAVRGQGAFLGKTGLGKTGLGKTGLGETRLAASAQTDPAGGLLCTGFPFRDRERLGPYLELFRELFLQVSDVRRAGAAVLDLAYVAAGRLEGFWEMGLKPWDLAAGLLLVEEAGGLTSDFAGGGQALWRGDVVAACPGLHGLVRAACGARFPDGGRGGK